MTEVVVTVGPSMNTPSDLSDAISAGARGFRVPLARRTGAAAAALCESLRREARRADTHVDIYLDVPAPKKFLVIQDAGTVQESRRLVATFDSGVDRSKAGTDVRLICDDPFSFFEAGSRIYLGDGEAQLIVIDVDSHSVLLQLESGALRAGHHGVVVPGKEGWQGDVQSQVTAEQLAAIEAIPWARVVLSFTEDAAQVASVREVLTEGWSRQVWGKVETRKGATNVAEIADATDGVLLGRGDLLLDTGVHDYFEHEQLILDTISGSETQLMVGTQLWTSSSTMPMPHRSELSYVCGLLARQVDFLLLSDETTVGVDPHRTIGHLCELVNASSR